MTSEALPYRPPPVRLLGLSLEQVQAASVWLMMASSFFVSIEPAPCDLLFLVALVLFAVSGLKVSLAVVPMILYLLLYNFGGFLSFLGVPGEEETGMFVITSAYMAVSAVFFAFYVTPDPLGRLAVFTNGYLVGAVIASVIGLIGYFNVAGLGPVLAPIERAQGAFKDPNVLSTYLIFPAVLLMQGFMLGNRHHRFIRLAALILVLAALFLAFSRGAWISFSVAAILTVVFTFVLTPSAGLRGRIIFLSIAGMAALATLIICLLSIESVRDLFLDRLTFAKDYDSGERGRFGVQANSIPYLLELPLGFGPGQFGKYLGQDPHNVFLNAFASYGWLGGISYLVLIVSTVVAGFKTMLMRTPWQSFAIVVFCPVFATILQGVQIDTDHWRHFYWLLGVMWGLFAASTAYIARSQGNPSQKIETLSFSVIPAKAGNHVAAQPL